MVPKLIRMAPKIDWYHDKGASSALACKVQHQTLIKTPTRCSVISEPGKIRGKPGGQEAIRLFVYKYL